MITLCKQIQVHFPQQRTKTVRIFAGLLAPGPVDAQPIAAGIGKTGRKQARDFGAVQSADDVIRVAGHYLDAQGAGQKRPYHLPACSIRMRAQHRKRVPVPGINQRLDIFTRGQQSSFLRAWNLA